MKIAVAGIVIIAVHAAWASMYTMERGSSVQLRCPGGGDEQSDTSTTMELAAAIGPPGKKGPHGSPGPPGSPGSKEPDSKLRKRYDDRITNLEARQSEQKMPLDKIGTITSPARNCEEIKRVNASRLDVSHAGNGLYYVRDDEENVFRTYCDMTTAGGGWTLVASVHENNMKGKCTAGDRWSSEQGNSAAHPHGDGFWENRATHGAASSATSDDYKNSGYFAMNARDVMIWHVPNDTPLKNFEPASFLKYRTSSGFLQRYGGNLHSLFSKHFPMRSKKFKSYSDNGPAIPIIWDRGSNAKMVQLTPLNSRGETEPGYIQFRTVNNERNTFALCPGVRMKPTKVNVEHVCVGSTSYNIGHANEEHYCGDFAAKDWIHSAGWNAPTEIINSVILIFYR